ncbi:MAG: hypothetical protein ABI638_06180 [Ignavibacteriota bacterium]
MIKYIGEDGTSKEKAIIILEAQNSFEGVDAEYLWLQEKSGEQNVEWRLVDQEFVDESAKQYDLLRIEFADGVIKEFWFDITDFFDKE